MPTERIEPGDHTVELNGTRLHYLDWGPQGKPPLILLHGFSSQAHYWDGLAVRLRDAYHVYALDQRGHGDSAWADDYTPEAMPADLAAFVDHLGLDRVTLLGHSMGGNVAIRYTVDHPDRVERLVLADIGLPHHVRTLNPDNSVQRALATDTFANEDAIYEYYRKLVPGLDWAKHGPALMHNFRQQEDGSYTYKFDPALRKRLLGDDPEIQERQRANAEHVRARTGNVTCPVLVIRGEHSDILSREHAEETVAAFPNAKLVEIPGTTHMVPTDNPRAFRDTVRDFLGLAPA
ncbi:MAG: alpha/beta hydrolase [Dehalococcoidia bacterium]|nr:alpha/beta hydrolase [Dehalococcoidia bacterium]